MTALCWSECSVCLRLNISQIINHNDTNDTNDTRPQGLALHLKSPLKSAFINQDTDAWSKNLLRSSRSLRFAVDIHLEMYFCTCFSSLVQFQFLWWSNQFPAHTHYFSIGECFDHKTKSKGSNRSFIPIDRLPWLLIMFHSIQPFVPPEPLQNFGSLSQDQTQTKF